MRLRLKCDLMEHLSQDGSRYISMPHPTLPQEHHPSMLNSNMQGSIPASATEKVVKGGLVCVLTSSSKNL